MSSVTVSTAAILPPPLRFTLDEAQAAADAWGFNCGPGALCAVLQLRPEQVRPPLASVGFENRRYTNPTMMAGALDSLRVPFRRVFESAVDPGDRPVVWPRFGLVRVQWSGPWTKPGVPMAARYRHTHWVGVDGRGPVQMIFDVNAVCEGGWLTWREWECQLVPWLLRECCPKGDGRWWPTHCWEIEGGPR